MKSRVSGGKMCAASVAVRGLNSDGFSMWKNVLWKKKRKIVQESTHNMLGNGMTLHFQFNLGLCDSSPVCLSCRNEHKVLVFSLTCWMLECTHSTAESFMSTSTGRDSGTTHRRSFSWLFTLPLPPIFFEGFISFVFPIQLSLLSIYAAHCRRFLYLFLSSASKATSSSRQSRHSRVRHTWCSTLCNLGWMYSQKEKDKTLKSRNNVIWIFLFFQISSAAGCAVLPPFTKWSNQIAIKLELSFVYFGWCVEFEIDHFPESTGRKWNFPDFPIRICLVIWLLAFRLLFLSSLFLLLFYTLHSSLAAGCQRGESSMVKRRKLFFLFGVERRNGGT